MTKTIEEELLDWLLVIMMQCYNSYLVPWRDKRQVAKQNQLNEKIDSSSCQPQAEQIEPQSRDEFVPLSIQEEGYQNDDPSSRHSNFNMDFLGGSGDFNNRYPGSSSHAISGSISPIQISLREDMEASLPSVGGNREQEESEHRFEFDKFVPFLMQNNNNTVEEQLPDLPPWLKNRVGVQITGADFRVQQPQMPPVIFDNANQQVVVSMQTWRELMSVVPWTQPTLQEAQVPTGQAPADTPGYPMQGQPGYVPRYPGIGRTDEHADLTPAYYALGVKLLSKVKGMPLRDDTNKNAKGGSERLKLLKDLEKKFNAENAKAVSFKITNGDPTSLGQTPVNILSPPGSMNTNKDITSSPSGKVSPLSTFMNTFRPFSHLTSAGRRDIKLEAQVTKSVKN